MGTRGVAISLFSGAGGLDLGAEAAGYEVRAAVEWDRDAAATMEKNFAHLASPVIREDILDVPTRRILGRGRPRGGRAAGPADRRPAVHAVLQVRVLAGVEAAGPRPGRLACCRRTRGCSREARPRRFVLENVYALTYNNKASRPAYERLLREIDEAGYDCGAEGAQRCRLRRPPVPAAAVHPRRSQGRAGARAPGAHPWRAVGAPRDRRYPAASHHRGRGARGSGDRPGARRGSRRQVRPPAAGRPARGQLPLLHREARVTRTRSSPGGGNTGRSCSSSRRTGRRRRSRRSLGPISARSTGTAAAFGWPRSRSFSPTRTISS